STAPPTCPCLNHFPDLVGTVITATFACESASSRPVCLGLIACPACRYLATRLTSSAGSREGTAPPTSSVMSAVSETHTRSGLVFFSSVSETTRRFVDRRGLPAACFQGPFSSSDDGAPESPPPGVADSLRLGSVHGRGVARVARFGCDLCPPFDHDSLLVLRGALYLGLPLLGLLLQLGRLLLLACGSLLLSLRTGLTFRSSLSLGFLPTPAFLSHSLDCSPVFRDVGGQQPSRPGAAVSPLYDALR